MIDWVLSSSMLIVLRGYDGHSVGVVLLFMIRRFGGETVESIEMTYEDTYLVRAESGNCCQVMINFKTREVELICGPNEGAPEL